MKKQILILLSIISTISLKAQVDSTGLAGDQVNLAGILELFQKSASPEEFEKNLNSESNQVHNLDLNADGDIDYIRVVANKKDDNHVFILQVPVSESENQDIAVIALEKTGKEEAQIQIIGDAEIFGEETILEPKSSDDSEVEDEDGGPSILNELDAAIIVNVWAWPSVRFVYSPGYIVWNSPWRWRVYPSWWRPWRPLAWSVWHPFRYRATVFPIRHHATIRCVHAHRVYHPLRSHSTVVKTRYHVAHKNYTVTKKRTTVTGPRGHSRTKTTTTVRGPQGKVKAKKTTTRRR